MCSGDTRYVDRTRTEPSAVRSTGTVMLAVAVLTEKARKAQATERALLPTDCRQDARLWRRTAEYGPAPDLRRYLDCAAPLRTLHHAPSRLPRVSQTWCRWFDSSRGHRLWSARTILPPSSQYRRVDRQGEAGQCRRDGRGRGRQSAVSGPTSRPHGPASREVSRGGAPGGRRPSAAVPPACLRVSFALIVTAVVG
jgi:hypothetical protein